MEEDEELRSYDVSALFTSVPVDKALQIVRTRLEKDSTLKDRTELSPDQIVNLCDVCLKQYFVYNGEYYEQLHGAAMDLPLSPILCDIYMEDLEQKAIETAPTPSVVVSLCRRHPLQAQKTLRSGIHGPPQFTGQGH